jgi:hypothetical protein
VPEKEKAPQYAELLNFLSSGGWIRTNDFWVMSPTSYLCSTPQYEFQVANIHYFDGTGDKVIHSPSDIFMFTLYLDINIRLFKQTP